MSLQLPMPWHVALLIAVALSSRYGDTGWAQDTTIEPFKLIVRRQGDDGSRSYRIPALAVTTKGTLIASFDIRWQGVQDLPADIDVGVMRSLDNGNSWQPMQIAMDYDKDDPKAAGNGVGDPAVLVDQKSGDIYLAALWSYGPRGWKGSESGLEKATTGQLVISRSRDDGVTWEAPRSITSQIKQIDWKLCFQGPGCGIQLKDGTLVFAAQYKNADSKPSSCFIHSRDGQNWLISPAAIPGDPPTSEAQVAQASDGSLLITMRNESREPERLWSRWEWQGQLSRGKWTPYWRSVQDPVCMASLIAHPSGILLLANNDSRQRERMTIRYSHDDGRTWSNGRLLDERLSAYSCLANLANGEIGLLYEVGDKDSVETLTFARFSLDWAMGH